MKKQRLPVSLQNTQVSTGTTSPAQEVQGVIDIKSIRNRYKQGEMGNIIGSNALNTNFVPNFGGYNGKF